MAILEIVLPVSLILGAVYMDVNTVATGFIILPLAIVNVTVGTYSLAASIGLVLSPLAFIFGVIRPNCNAWTMSLITEKVPFVNSAVIKRELFNKLQSLGNCIPLKID